MTRSCQVQSDSMAQQAPSPLTVPTPTFKCRPSVIKLLVGVMIIACGIRAWHAVAALNRGEPTALLTFPLGVIIPALVFVYLARLRAFNSAEGALMQLGTLVQLVLIVSWPAMALHLALGLPVMFLVVELFETRLPRPLREPVRSRILA